MNEPRSIDPSASTAARFLAALLTALATSCAERIVPNDVAAVDAGARDERIPPAGPDGACPSDAGDLRLRVCGTEGQRQCDAWAQAQAGAWIGYAHCTYDLTTAPYHQCIRGTGCLDEMRPSSCYCGISPACPPGYVCAAPDDASTPSCRCALSP